MKKVETILSPRAFEAVRELLISYGRYDVVISEVRSAQGNGERSLSYRGVDYVSDSPQFKLEAIVADEEATLVAHAILAASHGHDDPDQTVSMCALEGVFSIGISKLDDKTNPGEPSVLERGRKLACKSAPYVHVSSGSDTRQSGLQN